MKMDRIEKETLSRFLPGGVLNGFFMALGAMQDIIAKKALDAADWQITLLAMVWPVSNFFSIWWGRLLESSNNKSRYMWVVGFGGRLVLLGALWISNFYHLLFILTMVYSFNALYIPIQNSILQRNFRPKNRGRVFGYISSIATLLALITTVIGGRLLDTNEHFFRHVLASIGVLGFIGTAVISRIRINQQETQEKSSGIAVKTIIMAPLVRTWNLLNRNRDFALFQFSFFVYGLGFIMVVPVIPRFLVIDLGMTYTTAFLAKGVVSQLGLLFLSPLAGKIHDSRDPMLFTCIGFILISMYPLSLVVADIAPTITASIVMVFVSYLIYGIAMSAVNVSWNISSIYFAGDEDASMYQSVHITLTGVRGLLAPFLGYIVMELIGIRAVFILASCFHLTGALINWRMYRKHRKAVTIIPSEG